MLVKDDVIVLPPFYFRKPKLPSTQLALQRNYRIPW